ncbi:MAG: hypothetical protein LBR99_00615, partial [Treponema sp.]|nr:hypothetical protein [Treponema sp.]
MGFYFDDRLSAARHTGGKIERALDIIAGRYMGANPRRPYTARPFSLEGLIRNRDSRYEADFAEIFPAAPLGSYVYAWGTFSSEREEQLPFTLIPRGPAKLWVNGELVYGTDIFAERYGNKPVSFTLPVKPGRNHLVIRFTRTKAGFGGEFGAWLGKLAYYFYRGTSAYPEMEGFDYTPPLTEPLPALPPASFALAELCRPLPSWSPEAISHGCFGRIFGLTPGKKALALSSFDVPREMACRFSGSSAGGLSLYLGGVLAARLEEGGPFDVRGVLQPGRNLAAIISQCPGS